MAEVGDAIAQAHREQWARVVAGLARRFGDLDVAEEAAADAFSTAVARWPVDGVPPNPGGWLTTTAHRKALDRLRREQHRTGKHEQALMLYHDDEAPMATGAVDDERLRLVFTCCHPALSMEARVALTLRMVAGLTVAESRAGRRASMSSISASRPVTSPSSGTRARSRRPRRIASAVRSARIGPVAAPVAR